MGAVLSAVDGERPAAARTARKIMSDRRLELINVTATISVS
jgi:hypothetical protein